MPQYTNIFFCPYYRHVVSIYHIGKGCKKAALFTAVSKIYIKPIAKMSDSKSPPLGSFILNPRTDIQKKQPVQISKENDNLKDMADQATCQEFETLSVDSGARCKKSSDIFKTSEDSGIPSSRNQVLENAMHKTICQKLGNTKEFSGFNSVDKTKKKSDKSATSVELDISNVNNFESVGKKKISELTEGHGSVMMKLKLTGPPKLKKPILPVQLSQLVSQTVRQQYNDEKSVNVQRLENDIEDVVTRPVCGLNESMANVTEPLVGLKKNECENVTDINEIKDLKIFDSHVRKDYANDSLIDLDRSKGDDSGFVDSKHEQDLTPLNQFLDLVSDSLSDSTDKDEEVKSSVCRENQLKYETQEGGISKGNITETFSQADDQKSRKNFILKSDKKIKVATESAVLATIDTDKKDRSTPKDQFSETLKENADTNVKVETEKDNKHEKCQYEPEQEKKISTCSCNDDMGTSHNNDIVDEQLDINLRTQDEDVNDWLSSPLANIELSLEEESSNVNGKKKKRDKKKEMKNEDRVKRPRKEMPNYFISLQITNPEIHSAIDDVKNTILSKNKDLQVAMVPTPTIHLTLMVMYLADDKDIDRGKIALEKCAEKLGPLFDSKLLILDINGIGNFKNEIVFAKVSPGEALDDLTYIADTVKTCFEENDISSTDGKPFNPHITMMKLSKGSLKLKKKGIKKFSSDLYAEHANRFFGKQLFTGLHLCSMLKRKGPTGYYHIEHQVKIGPQKSNFSTLTSIQGHSIEDVSMVIVCACVQSAAEQVLSDRSEEFVQKMDAVPKVNKIHRNKNVKKNKGKDCSNKDEKQKKKKKKNLK